MPLGALVKVMGLRSRSLTNVECKGMLCFALSGYLSVCVLLII